MENKRRKLCVLKYRKAGEGTEQGDRDFPLQPCCPGSSQQERPGSGEGSQSWIWREGVTAGYPPTPQRSTQPVLVLFCFPFPFI